MSTLPTNSTFLPILDDLLSPDFRTVSLPGQTPQTPAETPGSSCSGSTAPGGKGVSFVESHTGQLTTKASNYVGVKEAKSNSVDPCASSLMTNSVVMTSSSHMNGGTGVKMLSGGNAHRQQHHQNNQQSAAVKIQQWWKVRNGKRRSSDGGAGVDVRAERAKHSIRHSRTEDHVRFLETEVHRLKSALATERKLRSLQVEAIRALWSQVQKVSSVSGTSSAAGDIMSQSMPNGLPIIGGSRKDVSAVGSRSGCMSMSFQGMLLDGQAGAELPCSCTSEILNLKNEMIELRKMVDQLKVDGSGSNAEVSHQKRPLTLNLSGNGGGGSRPSSATAKDESKSGMEDKKQISGYADQMASSIIEDVKEQDEEDND